MLAPKTVMGLENRRSGETMNKIYFISIILSGMLFKGYGENRQGDFALSFPSP